MTDQQAIDRLRLALVASAGGFLRNTRVITRTTCETCRGWVAGYERCFQCEHLYSHEATATNLGFAVYGIGQHQSGYMMRLYKQGSAEHYGNVQMLTRLTLIQHWGCAVKLAGRTITHWATVPSLRGRSGQHPSTRSSAAPSPAPRFPCNQAPTPGGRMTSAGPSSPPRRP